VSYVAGITSTVRLGIGVLVIPYRDAVLTAKSLATIDKLSGGRLDLGIGTGWSRAEFYALGRQDFFEARGAYTNEALDVMATCWQQEGEIAFEGQFHAFRKVQFEPKPVQRPRIPFWIGARGTAKAPLQRAAKYADVWHPTGLSPTELAEGSERINELAGREVAISIRGQVPITASVGEIQDWLGGYREVGCVQAAVDMKTDSFEIFMAGAARLAEARATFGV
jgi:probable F420-dependent oxidoreductase